MSNFFQLRLGLFVAATLICAPRVVCSQSDSRSARVVALFQDAQRAQRDGDDAGAAVAYRQIISIDAGIAEVWSNLGMVLFYSHQYPDAINSFEHALTLKPTLPAPHIFEGKAYLELNRPEKALVSLKAALAIAPSQVETLVALGDAYALTHEYPTAIRSLQFAIKQDPKSEDAASRLAVTYLEWATNLGVELRKSSSLHGRLIQCEVLETENQKAAEEGFRGLVAANPGSLAAHLAFAHFLIASNPSQEDMDHADAQIEAARKIAPRNEEVLTALISRALSVQDISAATAELRALAKIDAEFTVANADMLTSGIPPQTASAILAEAHVRSSEPKPPSTYAGVFTALEARGHSRDLTSEQTVEYASAAWHLHHYELALAALSRKARPSDESKYWLYRTCEELGKAALEKVLEEHPDSVRTHLLLADLALQQERFSVAREEYQKAMVLRPEDSEIALLYVHCLEESNDLNLATREAALLANRFPGNARLNFEAGDLGLKAGDDDAAAVRFLEQSAVADPMPSRVHVDLADAYARMQRVDDAITEVKKVSNEDTDGGIHYRLARWYKQTGRSQQAAEALEFCRRLKAKEIQNSQVPPQNPGSNPPQRQHSREK